MMCSLDLRAQYKQNSMYVVTTFSAEVTRSTNKATNHMNSQRLIIPREFFCLFVCFKVCQQKRIEKDILNAHL